MFIYFGCTGSWLLCGSFLFAASGGYSLVVVHNLLFAEASLVGHRLWGPQTSVATVPRPSSCSSWALEHRFSNWDSQAYFLCSMWDRLRSGIISFIGRQILYH